MGTLFGGAGPREDEMNRAEFTAMQKDMFGWTVEEKMR